MKARPSPSAGRANIWLASKPDNVFEKSESLRLYRVRPSQRSDAETNPMEQPTLSLDGYRSRGYVVVENAVHQSELDEADLWLQQGRDGTALSRSERYNRFGRVDFTKIPNLVKFSEPFRHLATSPAIVSAVEALLGQAALIFRDVVILKPALDGAELDYHQDSAYWDVQPAALISAWIPLRSVGLEDGCLRVIEGSHRRAYTHDLKLFQNRPLPSWATASLRKLAGLAGTGDSDAGGSPIFRKVKNSILGSWTRHFGLVAKLQDLHARVPDEEARLSVNLPIQAGSVILFHSMLLHGSTANVSGRDRLAYIVSYMGDRYLYRGIGNPELVVASQSSRSVVLTARVMCF
jgi:ectoine hydroxylase-related dioxygenase (phytanoyl-CoA dioxygenase family)